MLDWAVMATIRRCGSGRRGSQRDAKEVPLMGIAICNWQRPSRRTVSVAGLNQFDWGAVGVGYIGYEMGTVSELLWIQNKLLYPLGNK